MSHAATVKCSCRKLIPWLHFLFLLYGQTTCFKQKMWNVSIAKKWRKLGNCFYVWILTFYLFLFETCYLTIQPKNVNYARELFFCMNTYMNMVSTHAKNQRSCFLNLIAIDTFHIFLSETYYLTIQPKKWNEARELISCMNVYIDLVDIHAKTHRSSFFHVPEIGTFQVLWLKHVVLTM